MGLIFLKSNSKFYFLSVFVTQWQIRLIIKLLFLISGKLKSEGLSNLDKCSGSVIFASNHVSEWDGPLVRTVMPMWSRFGPMFYVGMDKEFYRIKRFGWRGYLYGSPFFKLFGAYPIYYGLKDYKESLRNHIKILKDGGSVTIFPEGKCSKDGNILEFKPGVIALSFYTRTPIVPVYIEDKKDLKNKRNIVIKFGVPYFPKIDRNLQESLLLLEYKKKSIELHKLVSKLSEKHIQEPSTTLVV